MKIVRVFFAFFETRFEKYQCPEIHGITMNSRQKRPISEFIFCSHLITQILLSLCFSRSHFLFLVPYWTSKEQMYALHTDGWESVLEMAVDVYRPDNIEGGHDRPVLVSFIAVAFISACSNVFLLWLFVSLGYHSTSMSGLQRKLSRKMASRAQRASSY